MTAKDTRAWVEAEKLLSELRASNPIYGSETDASPCCIFCGCLADNPGATPESHDPTCLWRRVHERAADQQPTQPFPVRLCGESTEQFDKRLREASLLPAHGNRV